MSRSSLNCVFPSLVVVTFSGPPRASFALEVLKGVAKLSVTVNPRCGAPALPATHRKLLHVAARRDAAHDLPKLTAYDAYMGSDEEYEM